MIALTVSEHVHLGKCVDRVVENIVHRSLAKMVRIISVQQEAEVVTGPYERLAANSIHVGACIHAARSPWHSCHLAQHAQQSYHH